MYDIVKYPTDELFFFDNIKSKIIFCKDIKEARLQWNKKHLILIEDYSFDTGLMKEIGIKKKLCFLIDLSRVIKNNGVRRAIEITRIRNFLKFCNKFGIFYSFGTFEERKENTRTKEEITNIALLFEINRGQAKFATQILKEYL